MGMRNGQGLPYILRHRHAARRHTGLNCGGSQPEGLPRRGFCRTRRRRFGPPACSSPDSVQGPAPFQLPGGPRPLTVSSGQATNMREQLRLGSMMPGLARSQMLRRSMRSAMIVESAPAVRSVSPFHSSSRMRTMPVEPSTSTNWSSLSLSIAPSSPEMHGIPYSLVTTAPCCKARPISRTIPPASMKSGVHPGSVAPVTKISPGSSFSSSTRCSALTLPRTFPGQMDTPTSSPAFASFRGG